MRHYLLAAFLTTACCAVGVAQTTPNCPQTLRLATSTYEQGRLHEVQGILDGCLKNGGFNDADREAAYKLLTLTYLYLEEPEKADETMLSLLRTNPYFEPKQASDPAEFIALYRTFRTRPIYRIGVNIGVNATQPNVSESLSTVADAKSEFASKVGVQFAVTADLPYTEKITFNGGVGYQMRSFELTSTHNRDGDLINTLTAIEKQSWVAVPLTVQYRIKENRYNPYVAAGLSADILITAEVEAERLREGQTSVEAKSFDLMLQRNKFNLSAIAAAGTKIRVGGGYIVVEAKYTHGITRVNNEETAYQDQDIYLSYGVPNTIFKLNSLSFTAAYIQNIFNPKKLTKKR